MLFSLGYRDAFPIDVWIKRIMESVYFNGEDTSKERIAEFARENTENTVAMPNNIYSVLAEITR